MNLTGGGAAKIQQEKRPAVVEPDVVIARKELERDDVFERI